MTCAQRSPSDPFARGRRLLQHLPMQSLDDTFDSVMRFYQEKFPGKGTSFYREWDWDRLRTALRLVEDPTVLDIGVANGALLRALCTSERHERVCGIDIRQHSMFVQPNGAECHTMSVTDMSFDDESFDTVVCMEVLEHLEVDDLPKAIAELARVCRHRLICTVPFREPEPLWHFDRPGGHRQSFDEEKLERLFPNALAILVPQSSLHWIMIVQDDRLPDGPFSIVEFAALQTALRSGRRPSQWKWIRRLRAVGRLFDH